MTKSNNTIAWRVEQLENCQKETEQKLDKIMENHLPHINEAIGKLEGEIKSLKTRIDVQTTIQVGAIILGALIMKYL